MEARRELGDFGVYLGCGRAEAARARLETGLTNIKYKSFLHVIVFGMAHIIRKQRVGYGGRLEDGEEARDLQNTTLLNEFFFDDRQ